MDKGFGSGFFPDSDPGDPKRLDLDQDPYPNLDPQHWLLLSFYDILCDSSRSDMIVATLKLKLQG